MVDLDQLMSFQRAMVIAPPGCGKTHLIAQAVAQHGGQRELILTHTHAGVDSIRQKLRLADVRSSRVKVETIAGWALRYVTAFPTASGFGADYPESKEDWTRVSSCAAQLLRLPAVARVLKASYSGIFVDEYQDCTQDQHELMLTMSKYLPLRILGDPLQGIFSFAGDPVDWESIRGKFTDCGTLETPWRWKDKNEELGQWLMEVREALERDAPVDLRGASGCSITYATLNGENTFTDVYRKACYKVAKRVGTCVAIFGPKSANQSYKLARQLSGIYGVVEPVECPDLLKTARKLDEQQNHAMALVLVDFLKGCIIKLAGHLSSIKKCLIEERSLDRIKKNRALADAVEALVAETSIPAMQKVVEECLALKGTKVYRRELLREFRKSLEDVRGGRFSTILEAARARREMTRRSGRRMSRFSVGRTLLVKGLEFDHVIVCIGDETWDYRDIYVALTRACRSLTVIARKPIIRLSR